MPSTKAYVLGDGEVVSDSFLSKYSTKSEESKQLPPDVFADQYNKNNLIEPLYNTEALAKLMEENAFHYRAVKTKARDVAGLGWKLEPRDDINGEPDESQKDTAMELLIRPNDDEHLSEVNDKVMVDFESTGNGYHEVIRDEEGNVVGLEHIPSHTIRRNADLNRYVQQRNGKKAWFKKFGYEKDVDYERGDIREPGELDEDRRANEILHIRNYTSRSDYYGLPDIIPGLGALLGEKERQEYNISFFENHAVPAYAVTVTGADLDEETEAQIQKFFQKDVKESNHSTLVLTAQKDEADESADPIEFKFEALSTEEKDASFQVFRQDNRDEILSTHGVPPYRAGVTVEGQLGGSSAAESTEIYKQSVIKPRQELLENQINRHILEEGLGVTDWRFRFEEIDTRDVDKEIERYSKLIKVAAFSPNGALEELGYEPVDDPNMDKHYLDGQPLETLNDPGSGDLEPMMNSLKSLHKELVTIARKDGGR